MINKIDFKAKNLTSNAGLFLLLENAKSNGIFDFIENDLVFDNDSTNKIKMNHIKTMLCGHFIGIDKLERLKLLQNDPLVNEFDISVKEPETVSRFLGNFNFKTTQMFRDINFKVFKKLLTKSKLTSITIDIDSSVINVEGHQEGASKGYNPKKLGNRCYNIQFAFCDELKAYVTGFVRSGNTYTANGAAEMIKEIVANIKSDDLEILFRMDSGYFDEKIIETIESLGCKYLIKPGTYVRPHRHPHTFELLLPLRGRFVVLNFDDRGTVTHRAILGETCTVLEMAAGTWHAVLSLDTGGIIFEVKHGGYQPVAADDYAHWAPAEGEPGTTELMAWYAQAQVGDSTFAV
ncbi:TPA: WbuC family cupin fold metalloprotein [Klebsiella aerogenes]